MEVFDELYTNLFLILGVEGVSLFLFFFIFFLYNIKEVAVC